MKHNPMILARFLLTILVIFTISLPTFARDQIRIVGSTAVYPFATAVAAQFGKTSEFKTPVIEATGTGGGIKIFCSGTGKRYPDIVNASRPMSPAEKRMCKAHGIENIIEIIIGYDGIVIGIPQNRPAFSLTCGDLFQALGEKLQSEDQWVQNPHHTWQEINANLQNQSIVVLGPPSTLGTREVFEQKAIKAGCQQICNDSAQCSGILRHDDALIEVAGPENVIVQKLEGNPNAIAIFSFGFLRNNRNKVQALAINGVLPSAQTITSGRYPLSRPLYMYVKQDQIKKVPGINEYLEEFLSDHTSGPQGYLIKKGLVPLAGNKRQRQYLRVMSVTEK